MITLRRSDERGRAEHGWLDTRHTFSFADYHDPAHMGYSVLRVINEDRIAPAAGFPTHAHRDMEILTYVIEGALEHKDSLGHGSVIRPSEVQRMSAGSGISHSEYNASVAQPVHLLQIWILPERRGLEPGYEQRRFEPGDRRGRLQLLASRNGDADSVTLHQDAAVYVTHLASGESVRHTFASGRRAWVQLVHGRVRVDGILLETGDGAAVASVAELALVAEAEAEVLLFDLP